MPKVSAYALPSDEREQLLNELETLFTSCRSASELCCLLRGLVSQDERVMLARRLRIAKELLARRPHVEIASELGVGLDTVNRVRRWLERERSTYHLLVERARRQHVRKQKATIARQAPPFSWQNFRRRFPLEFWPLDLIEEVGELAESYRRRHPGTKGN